MVSTTFQVSGDDSVFFWHRTCRRMRKSCCVPRNGKKWQSGQSSKSSSFRPAICLWGDNAETEVMLAVCLGGSAVVTLVLVHLVGLGKIGEKRGSKRVILPPQTAGKPFFLFWKAVRCATMDSFDVGALTAEPLVVFCVATAGKGGEICSTMLGNDGKQVCFWWWNHESWFFWSKIYWFFWSTSYGFPSKALLNCAELLQVNSVAMAETSFRSWAIAQTLLSMTWA